MRSAVEIEVITARGDMEATVVFEGAEQIVAGAIQSRVCGSMTQTIGGGPEEESDMLLWNELDRDGQVAALEALFWPRPPAAVAEGLVCEINGAEGSVERQKTLEEMLEFIQEFAEEWDAGAEDDGTVLPAAVLVKACARFGWEPYEHALALGSALTEINDDDYEVDEDEEFEEGAVEYPAESSGFVPDEVIEALNAQDRERSQRRDSPCAGSAACCMCGCGTVGRQRG